MGDDERKKHKEHQKIYPKKYRAKKKQESENIRKAQADFDKNAVLTSPKTQQNQDSIKILHVLLFL